MKIKIKKWQDLNWLLIGWIVSIVLVLINYQRWSILILGFFVIYIATSGLNKNINTVVAFFKKHLLLDIYFGILTVSCVYNAYDFNSIIFSVMRVLALYGLILFGYLISLKGERVSNMLRGFLIIIIVSFFFGIFQSLLGYNPFGELSDIVTQSVTRISSWYAHPIPCSCFFIVGVILCVNTIENPFIKVLISFGIIYGIILTQSRSAWLILIILFVIMLLNNFVNGRYNRYITKRKLVCFLVIVVLLFGVVFAAYEKILELYSVILDRLFSKSISEDMSYTWRLMTINLFINNTSFFDLHTYFGHGYGAASSLLANTTISSKFTYNVAATDNAYVSIFYDFGVFGFIGFVWIVFYSIRNLFRQKNIQRQYPYYILLVIMLFSIFFDAPYWISVGYLLAVFYGVSIYYSECCKY